MQFWLKMYIFTHASVFNVVLSLKLLLMGHILWALIPASDLYIWKGWAEREKGKRKKGQQWGQRKEKQAVRFVRADECVSWELQGDRGWSPTEDLISETMEQQDTQHQPGWRQCWTARPRCRCWQQQGSHYQNGLLKESARFSVRSLVKLSFFLKKIN